MTKNFIIIAALTLTAFTQAQTLPPQKETTIKTHDECCRTPAVKRKNTPDGITVHMKDGIENAKKYFGEKDIYIDYILISETDKHGVSKNKGWQVETGEKQCNEKFPEVIKYKMKLNPCIKVLTSDPYKKNANYSVVIFGRGASGYGFEFTVIE